jgi:hypothetical protein
LPIGVATTKSVPAGMGKDAPRAVNVRAVHPLSVP